jgi:DNA repair exonuclease SbcCD nuclease subunit
MSKPYGLVADIHLHQWSAFAEVTHYGMNSRLAMLLAELTRVAILTKQHGGDTLVIAGDLFHVRGSIAPSVLNPTMDTIAAIIKMDMKVIIIPGNHDLEGKDSERTTSAVTALERIGCSVIHQPMVFPGLAFMPWMDKIEDLKEKLNIAAGDPRAAQMDLILHAPINSVIMGIPDHGLDPEWLAKLGFRRVFSGHYHNHKRFCGDKVMSIGALAHHSWSDVGSLAGGLLVYPHEARFIHSTLPAFVELDGSITDPEELAKYVEGNYVRLKTTETKLQVVNEARASLMEMGAKGVVIINVKKPVEERDGVVSASVSAGASIQQSVNDYIGGLKIEDAQLKKAVELGAQECLAIAEIA